jgi:hypothetical protein
MTATPRATAGAGPRAAEGAALAHPTAAAAAVSAATPTRILFHMSL